MASDAISVRDELFPFDLNQVSEQPTSQGNDWAGSYVYDAVKTLNELEASPETNRRGPSKSCVSSAQLSSIRLFEDKVLQQGRLPDTPYREHFLDLMKGKDWYGGASNSVESYDKSRLKLLQGRVTPRPLRPMLPASSQRFLNDPKKYIFRSEQQLEELRDSGVFQIRFNIRRVSSEWSILETDRCV